MDTERRSIVSWLQEIAAGWAGLMGSVALCALLAVIATVAQSEQYRATGAVLVSPQRFLETEGTDALPALTENVIRLSATQAVLVPAAKGYADAANSSSERAERRRTATLDWLRDHLTVREVGQSSVIEVAGTAATQSDAMDLTRSAVEALTSFVRSARGVDRAGDETGEAEGLIVLSPGESEGKVSPTPVRNLLIGLNAGLLLGLVLALAIGRQRLRGRPDNVAAELGITVLGSIPRSSAHDHRPFVAPPRLVQVLQAGERGVAVLLTGTGTGDRTAQFAEALAGSLNAGGRRAVLVEGDLTGRAMTSRLGLGDEPGVTSVVSHVDPRDADVPLYEGKGDRDSVAVVPAGPPEAPGVLDQDRFSSLLEQLKDEFDVILITGPSLTRIPELLAQLWSADYCVLLTGEWTSPKDLEQARRLTQSAKPGAIGLIAVHDGRQWLRHRSSTA